jgi:hypothetical protein
VVRISGPATEIWLGRIDRFELYSNLIDWAAESKERGALLPLPGLASLRFNPFHLPDK